MEKDMIFFSPEGKGLTSTSANHVANLAKEMIQEIEISLAELTLYSTTVTLVGMENANVLNQGSTAADVEEVIGKLHRVADAKSLIAWLREGIKARDRMLEQTSKLTLEEYAKLEGIKLEEQPKRGKALTEDEYLASKSMDERCRYYTVETHAAVLGMAIHPGGAFADARKALQSISQKPSKVEGIGRDTLIYKYSPTVDESVVEDVYFRLQKQYREAQSRLNAMKHECKKAVDESAIAVQTEYTKALNEWANNRKVIESKHTEYIKQRSKEIGALKIRIPESLEEIYGIVSNLGKKEDIA